MAVISDNPTEYDVLYCMVVEIYRQRSQSFIVELNKDIEQECFKGEWGDKEYIVSFEDITYCYSTEGEFLNDHVQIRDVFTSKEEAQEEIGYILSCKDKYIELLDLYNSYKKDMEVLKRKLRKGYV